MVDIPNPVGGSKFRPYVKAIIEAERAPLKTIEARKGKENDKMKLLQDFTGKVRKLTETMREIDNFRKFREFKADLGDNAGLLNIDLDKDTAEPGEYQVEIVQLAGRHSMISNGYESPDDEIGVGYFWYQTAEGETRSVYLDSEHNTLKTLVKAINAEKDLGLQANLVNDGSGDEAPWRIIVSGKKTGMNEDIIYPEFYFVDGDVRFNIDDERAAQSAIIKLNGFEILTPENKVKDLIPGAALTLKQAKEGYEFTINIQEDTNKMAGKVKNIIDSINAVLEFINKQNQLDEKSDTSRTLGGDGMLRTIEGQLRNLILNPIAVSPDGDPDNAVLMRASELGIRFERSGQLSYNQELMQKKIVENIDSVANFFIGSNGFLPRLQNITNSLVGPGGMLINREQGFRSRMKQMDDQMAQKEQALSRKEDALKQKFGNLEATIQSLQSQQAYMMQALGGGGGPIPGL